MPNGVADFFGQVFQGGGGVEHGKFENGDFVGNDKVIASRTFGKWDPFVQPKKRLVGTEVEFGSLLLGWPILRNKPNVVYFLVILLGYSVDAVAHQLVECLVVYL